MYQACVVYGRVPAFMDGLLINVQRKTTKPSWQGPHRYLATSCENVDVPKNAANGGKSAKLGT